MCIHAFVVCILCLSKALSLKFLFGWSMEPLLQRDEWKYTFKTGKTVHYHVYTRIFIFFYRLFLFCVVSCCWCVCLSVMRFRRWVCGESWHAIKGSPTQFSRLGTWCPASVCVCVCVFGGLWRGGGGGGVWLWVLSCFFMYI